MLLLNHRNGKHLHPACVLVNSEDYLLTVLLATCRNMQADDPPYLSVGTEVSAKYKGAFCEAKVRKVVKNIKCKVSVLILSIFLGGKLY